MTTSASFSARRAFRTSPRDDFKNHPLAWAVPQECRSRVHELLRQVAKYSADQARRVDALASDILEWLKGAEPDLTNTQFAYECLVWAYALRSVGSQLDEETRDEIGQLLATIQQDAAASLTIGLEHQLLVVELPLILRGVSFATEKLSSAMSVARQALHAGLTELLDDKGLPLSANWPRARALLACWTRCLRMSQDEQLEFFDHDCRLKFDLVVYQLLQMSRVDGSQLFANAASAGGDASLLASAVQASGYPYNQQLAALAVPSLPLTPPRKINADELPTSHCSETARAAFLRSSWGADRRQIAVRYEGSQVWLELNHNSQTLVSGEWQLELLVDDVRAKPTSGWEHVCWSSDEEADYLEIEMRFTRGWRVQRQIVLPRNDGFAFFGESVLGSERARLELRSTMPLASTIRFAPAEETHEGSLMSAARPQAVVLPLGLPEWRIDHEPGSLSASGAGLSLHHLGAGVSLYAPWFFDLPGRKRRKQITWRRLSVGEHLVNQSRDVAAGFRIQADDQQWLVYRALASKMNRTVLGKNLVCDFFCGRFKPDGTTETLIEIE